MKKSGKSKRKTTAQIAASKRNLEKARKSARSRTVRIAPGGAAGALKAGSKLKIKALDKASAKHMGKLLSDWRKAGFIH